ncbi:MAG: hypothetical protein DRG83_16510, partial [Deltaproteobacteria bacterium]
HIEGLLLGPLHLLKHLLEGEGVSREGYQEEDGKGDEPFYSPAFHFSATEDNRLSLPFQPLVGELHNLKSTPKGYCFINQNLLKRGYPPPQNLSQGRTMEFDLMSPLTSQATTAPMPHGCKTSPTGMKEKFHRDRPGEPMIGGSPGGDFCYIPL